MTTLAATQQAQAKCEECHGRSGQDTLRRVYDEPNNRWLLLCAWCKDHEIACILEPSWTPAEARVHVTERLAEYLRNVWVLDRKNTARIDSFGLGHVETECRVDPDGFCCCIDRDFVTELHYLQAMLDALPAQWPLVTETPENGG